MARLGKEHLADVADDDAKHIRVRRERLGLDKKGLAELAGLNRNTLAAIENGESYNRTSLAKIERVLSQLEEEAGITAPPPAEAAGPELMEIRAEGVFGIASIVVSGPVRDAEALERSVARLIAQLKRDNEG